LGLARCWSRSSNITRVNIVAVSTHHRSTSKVDVAAFHGRSVLSSTEEEHVVSANSVDKEESLSITWGWCRCDKVVDRFGGRAGSRLTESWRLNGDYRLRAWAGNRNKTCNTLGSLGASLRSL